MKNNVLVIIALAIVALIVVVSARNALESPVVKTTETTELVNQAGNNVNIQDGYQVVKLRYENYQYQLYPNVMKKGVPVRMEVDLNTVTGCMVAVRIPSFNVAKTVRQGDNIITFTPDKTGTFNIACSMGMGRNTFTVVDDDGQTSSYVETAPAQTAGGSCGATGGGCGCGGKF
jgi:plastocyanin domain-containing protein